MIQGFWSVSSLKSKPHRAKDLRQPALVQGGGYRSRAQGRKESESWETMKEEASIGKGQGTGWGSPGHFSPREALGGGAWALPGWIFWLNLELAGEFWQSTAPRA